MADARLDAFHILAQVEKYRHFAQDLIASHIADSKPDPRDASLTVEHIEGIIGKARLAHRRDRLRRHPASTLARFGNIRLLEEPARQARPEVPDHSAHGAIPDSVS